MIKPEYEKLVEIMIAGVPALQRTGIKVLACRDGYAKIEMPLEGNAAHIGAMYAGTQFALGEMAGGAVFAVALDHNKYFPIAKEINIRFRKPAMTDVTMEITMSDEEAKKLQAEADEKGKADYQMTLEIKDGLDQVVSVVEGTWQVRPIPEGMKLPWAD